MSWEPQGLVKYECNECKRQFIVGMVDDKNRTPACCPFCRSEYIEDTVAAEPNEDYSAWLDSMGCMGIHYDPEKEGEKQ